MSVSRLQNTWIYQGIATPHVKAPRFPTRINIPFIPICQLSHSQRRLISVFNGKLPPKQYGSIVKKRAWIQHLSSLIKYHCFVSADSGSPASCSFCVSLRVSHCSRTETISLLNWPPILVILCARGVCIYVRCGRVLAACEPSSCKFLEPTKFVFAAILLWFVLISRVSRTFYDGTQVVCFSVGTRIHGGIVT